MMVMLVSSVILIGARYRTTMHILELFEGNDHLVGECERAMEVGFSYLRQNSLVNVKERHEPYVCSIPNCDAKRRIGPLRSDPFESRLDFRGGVGRNRECRGPFEIQLRQSSQRVCRTSVHKATNMPSGGCDFLSKFRD